MNPTIKDQLITWKEHQEPTKNKKYHQNAHNSHTEVLTESDIKSLMGMDMDVYTRHNGAVRRK